jgi:hypothetical protein
MLNIYFGEMPEAVYDTSEYFKNSYQDSWITKPLSIEMINDVDKSSVVSESLIESPVLGSISPLSLSGGVKTLLLIANDRTRIFNASTCGDNCAKWILKIADERAKSKQKLTVNLRHLMNFGTEPFKIKVLNCGKIATNMRELIELAGMYV